MGTINFITNKLRKYFFKNEIFIFLLLAKYHLTPGHQCLANMIPITTNWKDCKTAAEELGYTGDSVAHVDYDYDWGTSRPQGCFQSDGSGRFHFNKGAGGNSIGDDKILCVTKDQRKRFWGNLIGGY